CALGRVVDHEPRLVARELQPASGPGPHVRAEPVLAVRQLGGVDGHHERRAVVLVVGIARARRVVDVEVDLLDLALGRQPDGELPGDDLRLAPARGVDNGLVASEDERVELLGRGGRTGRKQSCQRRHDRHEGTRPAHSSQRRKVLQHPHLLPEGCTWHPRHLRFVRRRPSMAGLRRYGSGWHPIGALERLGFRERGAEDDPGRLRYWLSLPQAPQCRAGVIAPVVRPVYGLDLTWPDGTYPSAMRSSGRTLTLDLAASSWAPRSQHGHQKIP